MQSVVFLPEKMLPSPHKPEFNHARVPHLVAKGWEPQSTISTSAAESTTPRDTSQTSTSSFGCPETASATSSAGSLSPETHTMHSPAQRRLPTDQSRQPCTLYTSAHVLENCSSHLSTQRGPTSPEPSTVCRPSAQ